MNGEGTMVKNLLSNINYLVIALSYPLLVGCNGGGSAGIGGASGIAGGAGGGSSFATIHNPEPTTMLLMGGGMMAIAMYKKKFKK
jgi:hypothetical protein